MLTWRTLTTETTPQWSELTNILAKADDTDEFYDAEDLAEELTEHGFDAERDSWAVWDEDRLVAYGQLRVATELTAEGDARAQLDGGVHPDWRGRGIGTELLGRMEPRALELARERHPAAPVLLRAQGGKEGSDARPLLEDFGYSPARYFTDMTRPLPGEPLAAPDDARIRPFSPDLAEPLRLAHNDAFATHWGSTAQSPEQWADTIGGRSFRGADSRVLMDDGGAVLAYVVCGEWVPRELYISLVGTVQAARGRGLARQVLLATVADAAASGRYDVVDLGVDSQNPTGAGALYESVGFTPVRTQATYAKRPQP
ncbi:GNAT family N-acetyltransferase [Pseudactinotalea terrae]|uniref:GNAT family N-acetyltransferase n=1 Tax=Pseudactinotalea terrae TaxID=1743262 RepID=UPI0012E1B856|nr:GNAT family N-acetyltransferase [Pseudactinotalea terrae]